MLNINSMCSNLIAGLPDLCSILLIGGTQQQLISFVMFGPRKCVCAHIKLCDQWNDWTGYKSMKLTYTYFFSFSVDNIHSFKFHRSFFFLLGLLSPFSNWIDTKNKGFEIVHTHLSLHCVICVVLSTWSIESHKSQRFIFISLLVFFEHSNGSETWDDAQYLIARRQST